MKSDNTGRRAAFLAAMLKPLAVLSLVMLLPALAACTTAEGTNALVNPATFEREVMTSTLQGLDLVPQDTKKPDTRERTPLVLPKQVAQLPAPTTSDSKALPVDSNNPQINTAGLTDADLKRLRNARVVDLRSLGGRPLTDTERKQLTSRMAAANGPTSGSADRPLVLPPTSYFADYKGKETVCLADDGTVVSIKDPRCPAKIRDAMRRAAPTAVSVDQAIAKEQYDIANPSTNDN